MVSHYIHLLNITLNAKKETRIDLMDNEIKEINLLKVAAYIFHRKLVIIISFIISLCLGFIYINTLTKERVLYLDLDIIKSNELHEYSLINYLSKQYESSLGIDFMIINSENLGLLAQTIFNDRETKNDIIKSNNFLSVSLNDDIQLDNAISSFILHEPVLNKDAANLSGRKLTPYYQLRFKTNIEFDDQKLKNLFSHVLNEINDRVKEEVNSIYQRKIDILSIKNKFELNKLSNKKNNLIDDYIIKRKSRLLYLEENLAIAQAIEKDPDNSLKAPLLDNAKVNIYESADEPFPYYFYGTTAISQEILEVKKNMNVVDPSIAIDGILSINNEIRKINQINADEEINIALDASPLSEKNRFKVFSYDVDNIKYTYEGNSPYFIIFLFALIGVFFGFLLIFASYLKKEIKNLS